MTPDPGDAPHWAIHAPVLQGKVLSHERDPSRVHVNDRPVGTDSGAVPEAAVSNVNSSSSEFAAGLIDPVVYDVASVLSELAVRRVAPIAT
jgi:hypothetical protein